MKKVKNYMGFGYECIKLLKNLKHTYPLENDKNYSSLTTVYNELNSSKQMDILQAKKLYQRILYVINNNNRHSEMYLENVNKKAETLNKFCFLFFFGYLLLSSLTLFNFPLHLIFLTLYLIIESVAIMLEAKFAKYADIISSSKEYLNNQALILADNVTQKLALSNTKTYPTNAAKTIIVDYMLNKTDVFVMDSDLDSEITSILGGQSLEEYDQSLHMPVAEYEISNGNMVRVRRKNE